MFTTNFTSFLLTHWLIDEPASNYFYDGSPYVLKKGLAALLPWGKSDFLVLTGLDCLVRQPRLWIMDKHVIQGDLTMGENLGLFHKNILNLGLFHSGGGGRGGGDRKGRQ